jgi:hypothetical protein
VPKQFLHEHPDFKTLIEIVSRDEKINEPSLVEKDYWIMHVLWGLREKGFKFELKGGTSLSKGYGLIHRFSEDIDIQIHPPEEMDVRFGKNHGKPGHIDSRVRFFDWLAEEISIPGIVSVVKDVAFDDDKKYRNAGIRLSYDSHFDSVDGLKDGILLEVGFDKTRPNEALEISSWAYERATASDVPDPIDNRATAVLCYRPEYTFVEKIQTVIRKFRQFQDTEEIKPNFLRHYYDIYMLLACERVCSFIGTNEYQKHKDERFSDRDKEFGIHPAFEILSPEFETAYKQTAGLYYRGQVELSDIVNRITPFLDQL